LAVSPRAVAAFALVVAGCAPVRTPAGGGAATPVRDGGAPTRDARAKLPPADPELDPAMVAQEVRSHLGGVKACYERQLKENPKLTGRVTIHWTITPTGHVTGANVEGDAFDRAVADCIIALVGRWKFPAPAGGSVDVAFPFVFQLDDSTGGGPPKPQPPPKPESSRLPLGKGTELVTTLTGVDEESQEGTPRLEIAVTRRRGVASPSLLVELTPARYPVLAEVLKSSQFWTLKSWVIQLGKRRVVRVGLVGQVGDDLAVVQEIALLVAIEGDPKLLWIGLGSRKESQFDVCIVDTFVSFRPAGAGKVERRASPEMWVDPPPKGTEEDPFADYRKDCKKPPPRTDVFPLEP
jgi:hypothetical protein